MIVNELECDICHEDNGQYVCVYCLEKIKLRRKTKMPNGDGTGPNGDGPRTGRGKGGC